MGCFFFVFFKFLGQIFKGFIAGFLSELTVAANLYLTNIIFLMLPVSRLELGQRLSLMCYRGVLLSLLANQTQRSSLHFCLSVVFWQAQRARSMGAIVYCVGVKEFNQTQVGSNGGY